MIIIQVLDSTIYNRDRFNCVLLVYSIAKLIIIIRQIKMWKCAFINPGKCYKPHLQLESPFD